MKDRKQSWVSLLLAVVISCFLMTVPGCKANPNVIDRDLSSMSLVNLWERIANVSEIKAESANLDSFSLRCDEDGWGTSLYLTFHANNRKGDPEAFQVSMNRRGEIGWSSFEETDQPIAHRPGTIFSEIDSIGLSSLKLGDAGLALEVHLQSGDVGYRQTYSDIYHLENGVLKPLEEVVFHSTATWGDISIFKLFPEALGAGVSSTMPSHLPQERTSQIWFLTQDIKMASVVKYLDI